MQHSSNNWAGGYDSLLCNSNLNILNILNILTYSEFLETFESSTESLKARPSLNATYSDK